MKKSVLLYAFVLSLVALGQRAWAMRTALRQTQEPLLSIAMVIG
jgi:hypothetical protein